MKHITIQSMTNTDTADIKATVAQAIELIKAGSELVRVTVNTDSAAKAIPKIRAALNKKGYSHIPLIGDFHYNGHTLLSENPAMAHALDKYRINPGNVGFGDKHDYYFAQIIKIAIANKKEIRIGVNGGSLDQDLLTDLMNKNAAIKKPKAASEVFINAMVQSAIRSAKLAEKLGLPAHKITLSVKMSDLPDMVAAYRLLARKTQGRYPLHLGLTEAGGGLQGIISSSAALAILLHEGIGDTIRVSITPDKTTPRTREVEVCKELLQALGLRHFKPKITSCPGCGRTGSTFFQDLAAEVSKEVAKRMPTWQKKHPHAAKLKIAVMGCIVNGPGEAAHADIAIALPGKMEREVAPVYIKGKFLRSLQGKNILAEFMALIEEELASNL